MNLAEMLAMADKASEGIEVSERTSFEPVKPGDYSVLITNAEGPKPSKRANPNNPNEFGSYLHIELTIQGGEYNGRKLWFNNNILVYPASMSETDVKKAQTAMAMGSKERKVILDSIHKAGITTAEELVGASFMVKVAIEKMNNGTLSNVVKTVYAARSASTPTTSATPAPAAAPARPKMPWEK